MKIVVRSIVIFVLSWSSANVRAETLEDRVRTLEQTLNKQEQTIDEQRKLIDELKDEVKQFQPQTVPEGAAVMRLRRQRCNSRCKN